MCRPLAFFTVLLCAWQCQQAQAQRRGVYNDLTQALQQPEKVRVLDLRGQWLDSLPRSVYQLQQVEVLLVGMKRRNLWGYPRAWKYLLHVRHLPAGGFLHLQGRGAGNYYRFNRFKTTPLNFCRFPKLQVLDIGGSGPFVMADTVACQMARCRPQVIVLGGNVPPKEPRDYDAEFWAHMEKYRRAEAYLHRFKIK